MKKLKILLITILTAFILCGCSNDISNMSIDYGESTIYSEQDMDDATKVILDHFKNWSYGYTLYTVSYSGDEFSLKELEYRRKSNPDIDECIVFYTSFLTPDRNNTGFTPNEVHSMWKYILVRSDNGKWEIVGRGHG